MASLQSAWRTLEGLETTSMVRKGRKMLGEGRRYCGSTVHRHAVYRRRIILFALDDSTAA